MIGLQRNERASILKVKFLLLLCARLIRKTLNVLIMEVTFYGASIYLEKLLSKIV